MPLPPYSQREDVAEDRERYQTVYAKSPGAVAAPTAGLHFTTSLLDDLKAKGIGIAEVLLHVGLGTFQPIEVEDLGDHEMHGEWYDLPSETVQRLDKARGESGRIVAVGTTAVRVLETCSRSGRLAREQGWTNIFIYPPYTFRMTDALLTNFHLPASTLLALRFAFAIRSDWSPRGARSKTTPCQHQPRLCAGCAAGTLGGILPGNTSWPSKNGENTEPNRVKTLDNMENLNKAWPPHHCAPTAS